MVSTMPLGLFLQRHRLVVLFLLNLRGRFEVRLAEFALVGFGDGGVVGCGGPSGGSPAAMFSARSISCAWRRS